MFKGTYLNLYLKEIVMRLGLIFPLLLIVSAFACQKPEGIHQNDTVWTAYAHPRIIADNIYDTLPALVKHDIKIEQLKGVKVFYPSGSNVSYFEYKADAKKLIDVIGRLPFKKCNEVADTLCRKMELPYSLAASKVLSKEELMAANFYWKINVIDYDYYECLKSPMRHTILVNRNNGRILHRIEKDV
jgi:hypothetical protein